MGTWFQQKHSEESRSSLPPHRDDVRVFRAVISFTGLQLKDEDCLELLRLLAAAVNESVEKVDTGGDYARSRAL